MKLDREDRRCLFVLSMVMLIALLVCTVVSVVTGNWEPILSLLAALGFMASSTGLVFGLIWLSGKVIK